MEPEFYSYLWLREDETPYYAGKGCNNRAFRSHVGHRPPKDRSRILIMLARNEAEAFVTEIELIRNWGRKDNGTGILHNRTDGGDGMAGNKPTEEARRNMSVAMTGNKNGVGHKMTEECRLNLIKAKTGNKNMVGYKPTEETRRKMSESRMGLKPTEEARRNMSEAAKGNKSALGYKHTEEARQKMHEAKAGKPWSAARRSASLTGE